MSGICGVLSVDGAPVAPGTLAALTRAGTHRGPDGVRVWEGTGAALAHLALHVTARDARETQPLVDGNLVLVADARIDNRSALRRALRDELRTPAPTDAELILAAYRHWGTDCARHLIGDFAFAVWDTEARRLFAARDPMAMRALHYAATPTHLLFATDVAPLLAAPGVRARPALSAVAAHVAGVPMASDQTFFEDLRALPAAHALSADRDGVRTWRYWDIDPTERISYADEDEYVDHFRELFAEAVRCRLQDTDQAGLFLSGGVDSGSIAATAGWLREQGRLDGPPLRTYSWAFPTLAACDERAISSLITTRYGQPATAIDVEAIPLIGPDPATHPDRDEPFTGVYQALLHAGLTTARDDGARLMLMGHRGDLVAGEPIYGYADLLRHGRLRTFGRELRHHAQLWDESAWSLFQRYAWGPWKASLRERLGRTVHAPVLPSWMEPALRDALAPPSAPPWPTPAGLGPDRRQRYWALLGPFHMRTATWLERLAARAGLAYADPWSDRRLVSFALAVPPRVFCRAGYIKQLPRRALAGIMPEAARRRVQKVNPEPLWRRSLVEHARPYVESVCSALHSEALGWVDGAEVQHHCRRYYQDETRAEFPLWDVLTLDLWLRALPAQNQPFRSHDNTPSLRP